MMRTYLEIFTTATLAAVLGLQALSTAKAEADRREYFRIIANPSLGIEEITTEDLKAVFLFRKNKLASGMHLEPVLLNIASVHETFCEVLLEKTAMALESYYRSRVFSGAGMAPRSFDSESAMLQYISKTKGAIGYLLEGRPATGVKTLRLKKAGP